MGSAVFKHQLEELCGISRAARTHFQPDETTENLLNWTAQCAPATHEFTKLFKVRQVGEGRLSSDDINPPFNEGKEVLYSLHCSDLLGGGGSCEDLLVESVFGEFTVFRVEMCCGFGDCL